MSSERSSAARFAWPRGYRRPKYESVPGLASPRGKDNPPVQYRRAPGFENGCSKDQPCSLCGYLPLRAQLLACCMSKSSCRASTSARLRLTVVPASGGT